MGLRKKTHRLQLKAPLTQQQQRGSFLRQAADFPRQFLANAAIAASRVGS
jgi:hypothetical protein